MATTYSIVEDEADDGPRHVVDRSRGRDHTEATKYDGEVDILDDGVRPLQMDYVCDCRCNGTNKEEEKKATADRWLSGEIIRKATATY